MSSERGEILSTPARLTGVPWRMHLLIGFRGLATLGQLTAVVSSSSNCPTVHAPKSPVRSPPM